MDPIQFGKELGALVREQVAKTFGALSDRLAALEQRFAALPTPKDGTSVTVAEAVKAIRVPEDGKSVDLAEVVAAVQPTIASALDELGKGAQAQVQGAIDSLPNLAELVTEAVKALPPPKDGVSVTAEQVLPALQDQLREAIAAIPAPANGKSVTLAEVVDALLPTLLERADQWHAKFELDIERRTYEMWQRMLDRMPAPRDGKDGKDGVDGLSADDLTFEYDGERDLKICFQRDGVIVKEITLNMPIPIDRGFWKEGRSFVKGDFVTFGGSSWIAQVDTTAKPEVGQADWRLSSRRGRDAK
jgi:hypothetical protein